MILFPIGIVLYKPAFNSINRILNFAKNGYIFYIFDNSPIRNDQLININNINYFPPKNNYGLSYSIDFLCKNVINDNYKYLLFFDQDTVFTNETLDYIKKFIHYKESSINIYFDSVISINFRENSIQKNKLNVINKTVIDKYELLTIYFNINSGTLFMLNKYKSFSWFDKSYFVDGVDYSFSLNVLINKFKNISISNVPGLNHTQEQGDITINFLGIKLTSRVYPFSRNIDFLKSHTRLLLKTLKINSIKPKLFILKAISSYIITQLIFRLRSILFKKTLL